MELTQAIKTRHAAFFKTAEFLQNKDLPNAEGLTPLMVAVQEKSIEVVKLLLAARVDLNLVDKKGHSALMLAAGKNFLGAIKALVAAKADLGVSAPPGVTALSIATKLGNAEAARILKNAEEVTR